MFNKALRASEGICRKLLGDKTCQKTHTHVYAERQGKTKKEKKTLLLLTKSQVSL